MIKNNNEKSKEYITIHENYEVKIKILKTKIEEYMPFGLIPIFINTRIK